MALGFYGAKAIKYWNGSSWTASQDFGNIKMWDGSQWRVVQIQPAQDITVTFSPDGSTSSGSPTYLDGYAVYPSSASKTITASIPVTWTWSYTGDYVYSTVASGGSSSSISFTLGSDYYSFYYTTISLSASGGGVTKYWQIDLGTEGLA